MLEQDTICALSTPPGTGGIAVLRLSGPDALRIARACSDLSQNIVARMAYFCRFKDAEGGIDEGLLTWFRAPSSYTGEDVVELSVHGSPYIAQRLLEALSAAGARTARPGEFTLRAFLNRKLDLSQAEAVADLIASSSRAAHKLALQQLRGGYSERIEGLRQKLIDFCALIELELDFSEEDVEFARRDDLLELLNELMGICNDLINSFRYGNAVRQGVPVAIIGAPNSGKSTLLNALLQEDRAIVSDIPGTTRDTVEETITIGGVLFRFIDTAGIRSTEDTIEKLGIERSFKKAREASIVVYLGDATVVNESAFRTQASLLREQIGSGPQLIPVLNKVDLPEARRGSAVMHISARSGEGLDELKDAFIEHVQALQESDGGLVVTNARHVEALGNARHALHDARQAMANGVSGEFLATDLRRAQHHLGEITGRITPDDILGSIFGKFCIGK
ncbi:MAG: tRNA uridine-5-carboxymethylaminomethyl(34) synthesis GTPase MnmE [Flavobacteriales bacterium]|nr:MAG: tRNA uridine-5-carboxymethylaminomethyl(34) synthesis GTPase MnmE [Flavobacteriales bacterium]